MKNTNNHFVYKNHEKFICLQMERKINNRFCFNYYYSNGNTLWIFIGIYYRYFGSISLTSNLKHAIIKGY